MSVLDIDNIEVLDYHIAWEAYKKADENLKICKDKYQWNFRTKFENGEYFDLPSHEFLMGHVKNLSKLHNNAKSKIGQQGKRIQEYQATIKELTKQLNEERHRTKYLTEFLYIACKDAYQQNPNMDSINSYISSASLAIKQPLSVPVGDNNEIIINLSVGKHFR